MIRVDIMNKNVDKNNTKEVITVEDIDRQKRKPNEWAKIYNIKLIECDDYNALQNEYEWAWEMMHSYKYLFFFLFLFYKIFLHIFFFFIF